MRRMGGGGTAGCPQLVQQAAAIRPFLSLPHESRAAAHSPEISTAKDGVKDGGVFFTAGGGGGGSCRDIDSWLTSPGLVGF